MKRSVGSVRTSKGIRPVRVSGRGSVHEPSDRPGRSSSNESRLKTHIPILKGRSSSNDRDSRSRMKAPVDLSSKKKRSRSHATPSTPLMYLEAPHGFGSATSVRSRSGSRCSSAERGFMPHKGKVTDTRPIKDHGFQHRAMVRVYNYFQSQPQDIRNVCPLPNTRSIMIQSFVDMMAYLLQHFFINHGVYKKNYTEEIPKLMKILSYPGTVSSSWLKTVNAPHAWPHVVAVLSWLVDLVVGNENTPVDDYISPAYEEEDSPERTPIFFTSILSSFQAWDEFKDDVSREIDQALQDALKQRQQFPDEEIERMIKENEEVTQQLNDPIEQKAIKDYESLVENVKTLASKEVAISRAMQDMETSIEDAKDRWMDYENQKTKLEQGIELKIANQKNLALVVANQPMSKDGAKDVKEELSVIVQEIKNNNSYLSELQKMKCTDDIKMASKKHKLNDMCVDFNKEILQSNFSELHKFSVQTNLNFFERDLEKASSEMNYIDRGLQELKSYFNEKMKLVDCAVEKLEEDMKELLREEKRIMENDKELEEKRLSNRKELDTLEVETEKNQSLFKADYDSLKSKCNELVNFAPDIVGLTAKLNETCARETELDQKLKKVISTGTAFLRSEIQKSNNYKREVMEYIRQNLEPEL